LIYLVGNDPKFNTEIQRSWGYTKDAGIKAVEKKGTIVGNTKSKLPEFDNYLSLSIPCK
jgi:hypothetical protein